MTDTYKAITGDGEVKDIDNVMVKRVFEGGEEDLSISILNNRISKLGVSIEKAEKEIAKCKDYVSFYNKLLPHCWR